MIRGKAVEEAIRFAFSDHKDKYSVISAQDYANDYFYLRTKKYSSNKVNYYAKPINALVQKGINAFTFMGANEILNVNSFNIGFKKNNLFVFPDFKLQTVKLDQKIYKNVCIELKIINKREFSCLERHKKQCYNYIKKTRKPVILLYLVYYQDKDKSYNYESFPKFYVISKK